MSFEGDPQGLARHILETLNFEVDEAGDGQEALTLPKAKMPDVVLLDWNSASDERDGVPELSAARPATPKPSPSKCRLLHNRE